MVVWHNIQPVTPPDQYGPRDRSRSPRGAKGNDAGTGKSNDADQGKSVAPKGKGIDKGIISKGISGKAKGPGKDKGPGKGKDVALKGKGKNVATRAKAKG